MAQIRLDDDVYNRLKECADSDKRTVGEEIHYLLDNRVELVAIYELIKSNGSEKNRGETLQIGEDYNHSSEINDFFGSKKDTIATLLEERANIIEELKPQNLSREIQKLAVEESWSDEQCQEEADKLKAQLEYQRDNINGKLHELGM